MAVFIIDTKRATPRGHYQIYSMRGTGMTGPDKGAKGGVHKGGRFLTTHWTVVRDADYRAVAHKRTDSIELGLLFPFSDQR